MNDTQHDSTSDQPEDNALPQPAKTSHGNWWWLVMIVIGLAMAGGYMAFEGDMPQLGNRLNPPTEKAVAPTTAPSDPLPNASQRAFEQLQERVTQLEQALSRLTEQQEQQADLAGRLEQMESKLDSLNIASNSELAMEELMALRREVDTLTQTVNEQARRPDENRKARMLLAFDRLKEQILTGEPYDHALQALSLLARHAKVEAALDGLAAHQYRGLPTPVDLKQALAEAIAGYYEQPEAEADNTLEAVKQNLSQLVTVRKVGSAHTGDDPGARIARAESALKADDITSAITELKALPPAPRAHFTGWLEQAARFRSGRRQLKALEQAVIASLEQINQPRPVPIDDRPTSNFGG